MKNILLVVGLIAMLVIGGYAVNSWNTWRVKARTSRFNEDIENLFAGLQKYKEVVGSYPVGSNADVVQALKGKNPKSVIVLVGRKTELNEKGEYVDPWGTALRASISRTTGSWCVPRDSIAGLMTALSWKQTISSGRTRKLLLRQCGKSCSLPAPHGHEHSIPVDLLRPQRDL
jgi:hypothetical protein